MCICFLLWFFDLFFICSWNYQQQIEIHVCFVDMFSPGGGGKIGPEFPYILEWWSALLRLKKWENWWKHKAKSRDKKSSWRLKGYSWKRLCHFTGLLYPKHMVHLLKYGLVSQEWSIWILIALLQHLFQSVFVQCLTTANLTVTSISNVTFTGETNNCS